MADKEAAEGLVVPKFSSFKSSPSAQPQKDPEGAKSSSKRTRDEDRGHRSSHGDEKRRHKADDRRVSDKDQPGRSQSAPKTASSKDADFLIDVKGDPLIRKYGGSNKWATYRYRRHGRGKILGTDGRLLIEYEGSRQVFSILWPGQGLYSSKHRDGLRARHTVVSKRNIRLRRTRNDNQETDHDGYIAVDHSQKPDVDDSSEDDSKTSYRSIHGKAKVEDDDEISSQDDDSTIDDEQQNNDPLKQRTIILNREVKDNPENTDAWFQLIDHQDTLMRAGRERELLSENERHSYSEIKVDLLESALRHAQLPSDRDRIILMLMREGPKVWSHKVTLKKWSELESSPLSYDLWKLRVRFAMVDISTFQHTAVKVMFLERLQVLFSADISTLSLSAFQESIDIFLRMTRFLYDCGYKELAICAWQAMIELVYFRPDIEHSSVHVPSIFGDFWESEAPRIGEIDATGWKQFVFKNGLIDPPEPADAPRLENKTSRDALKAWGLLESKLSDLSRTPARTLDDGNEMDPYRVIMLADIQPLLFFIPSQLVQQLSSQIISSFLIFCGFPPLSMTGNPYIQSSLNDSILHVLHLPHAPSSLQQEEEVERRQPHSSRSMIHASLSPSLIFGSPKWPSVLSIPAHASKLDNSVVMRILNSLSCSMPDAPLATYSLGLVSLLTPSLTKKVAKTLLKQYPEEVALYTSYGLAEYSQNHLDAANKILHAALASTQIVNGRGGMGLIAAAASIKTESGHHRIARQILCSVGAAFSPNHDAEPSTNDILKAEQVYQSNLETSLRAKDLDTALQNAECLTLLCYLTVQGSAEPMSSSQGNISAAMDKVSDILGLVGAEDFAAPPVEAFVQFAVQLLYSHASNGPFRRAYFKDRLMNLVNLFPQNTTALTVFEWVDTGMRIIDETRTLLETNCSARQVDCLATRVFAIEHEQLRGNIHTTRSAYERAVASDAGKDNPGLWVSYIRFCFNHRQLRSKAQGVFYRAIKHCPWSKDVAMEAFVTLIRDMKSADLRSIYDMMVEKGLRIHVDLDEFLESRKE